MKRSVVALIAGLALSPLLITAAAVPASAHDRDGDRDRGKDRDRPVTYQLEGDPGGSKFEGIGTDQRRRTFYVTEVTGGEIHRGDARSSETEEWLAGDGTDGRFTARGVTTDRRGNVYIAGGPNRIDTGGPDLWVYDKGGDLLAALQVPGEGAYLNDVWIGPDGAAYFTDSNGAQIFKLVEDDDNWTVTLWTDASDTIATPAGFNLNGIVTSPDRKALVVAQSNTGQLWRFDLSDASASLVDTGSVDLTGADGLVRRGTELTVVRNFPQVVTTLKLAADGRSATLIEERASDPSKVFTTAKYLGGRILYLDSKFEEQVPAPPYEVVTNPFRF